MKKEIRNEEMLNDEQMEQVSGSDFKEAAEDSKFLSTRLLCRPYDSSDLSADEWDPLIEIQNAWEFFGITMHTGIRGNKNNYYYNGNKISREQAYVIAQNIAATLPPIPACPAGGGYEAPKTK